MTILERLSLIKAGYNRKEIDAMIEEEKNTGTNTQGADTTTSHDATDETTAPASSGAGVESEKEEAPTDSHSDSTDEALKEAMDEIEKLKSELKTAQEFNTQKDVSETVDDDAKTVEDIVRSFM